MARRRHQRLYDVHLMKVVNVKVARVEADDMRDAIEEAEGSHDWYHLFRDVRHADTEYNEDTAAMLVDIVGDEEFNQSRWFDSITNPLMPLIKEIVDNEKDPEKLAAAIAAARRKLRDLV